MSPSTLPTPSGSPSSNLRANPILDTNGQGRDDLGVRIEEQRAKIRALQLAAKDRRRADQVRIQERAREAESRRQVLRQRLLTAVGTEDGLVLARQQEERMEQRAEERRLVRMREKEARDRASDLSLLCLLRTEGEKRK
jgi:hypothetical protein